MTIRSLTGCMKYQLKRMTGILAYIPIFCIVTMPIGALIASLAENTPFTLQGSNMTGIDVFCAVVMFVFMCCYSHDFITTAAANGASRKTAVLSQLLTVIIVSLLVIAECAVLSPLTAAIAGSEQVWGAEAYGAISILWIDGMSIAAIFIRLYIVCFISCITAGATGVMLTAIFYRLPTFIAAIVAFLIVFGPNLGVMAIFGVEKMKALNVWLIKLAGVFADGPKGNVAQAALFFSILTAVEIAAAFLLLLRASVKPLPVKGE